MAGQAHGDEAGSQSGPQRGGINRPVTEQTSHVADTKEDQANRIVRGSTGRRSQSSTRTGQDVAARRAPGGTHSQSPAGRDRRPYQRMAFVVQLGPAEVRADGPLLFQFPK